MKPPYAPIRPYLWRFATWSISFAALFAAFISAFCVPSGSLWKYNLIGQWGEENHVYAEQWQTYAVVKRAKRRNQVDNRLWQWQAFRSPAFPSVPGEGARRKLKPSYQIQYRAPKSAGLRGRVYITVEYTAKEEVVRTYASD